MRGLEAEPGAVAAGGWKALLERLEQPQDVQPVRGHPRATAELCVGHASGGQLLQPRHIGLQAVQQLRPFRVLLADLHHGQGETHACQWRTRFVGDRLGQDPLPIHHVLQLRSHAGQRLTQRPHQVGTDGRRRDGQLSLLDRQCHVPKRVDIAPQPVHQEIQGQCDGDDEDADHHRRIHVFTVVPGNIGLLGLGEIAQHQDLCGAGKPLVTEASVRREHQSTLVQMLQRRHIEDVRRLGQRHDLQRVGELHLQVPGELRPVCLRRIGIACVQKMLCALQLCSDLLVFALLGEGCPQIQPRGDQHQVGQHEAQAIAQEQAEVTLALCGWTAPHHPVSSIRRD